MVKAVPLARRPSAHRSFFGRACLNKPHGQSRPSLAVRALLGATSETELVVSAQASVAPRRRFEQRLAECRPAWVAQPPIETDAGQVDMVPRRPPSTEHAIRVTGETRNAARRRPFMRHSTESGDVCRHVDRLRPVWQWEARRISAPSCGQPTCPNHPGTRWSAE